MKRRCVALFKALQFPERQSGSAVMFALFACLVASVAVEMLVAAVICGQRALLDEGVGRDRLAAVDACLGERRQVASTSWGASPWEALGWAGSEVVGRLAEVEDGASWALRAEARTGDKEGNVIATALVERGRDGLDLPIAGIVADEVLAQVDRTLPWLVGDGCEVSAFVRYVNGSMVVGEGCSVTVPEVRWELGEGWRLLLAEALPTDSDVVVVETEGGASVNVPDKVRTSSCGSPVLVVAVGGGDLDMRDLGEVWGVIVVDGGSACIEGSVVHGAVCVTERVDVGARGQVVFDQQIWGWSHDGSLFRTRLVPGSRREGVE